MFVGLQTPMKTSSIYIVISCYIYHKPQIFSPLLALSLTPAFLGWGASDFVQQLLNERFGAVKTWGYPQMTMEPPKSSVVSPITGSFFPSQIHRAKKTPSTTLMHPPATSEESMGQFNIEGSGFSLYLDKLHVWFGFTFHVLSSLR